MTIDQREVKEWLVLKENFDHLEIVMDAEGTIVGSFTSEKAMELFKKYKLDWEVTGFEFKPEDMSSGDVYEVAKLYVENGYREALLDTF